jgi:hypothetical protein
MINLCSKLAIIFWCIGGVMIVGTACMVVHAYRQPSFTGGVNGHIAALVAGVVLLATGGTLNKIGRN